MIAIVGMIIVTGCVLGGFSMAGGHVMSLYHPSELVTIGGAAAGALVIMAPKKVLIDLVKGLLQIVKGSPYNKKAFMETFLALFEMLRLARRDGTLALEPHLSHPHDSTIFSKYHALHKNHHATEFIVGSLMPIMDGSIKPEQLGDLMATELKTIEDEHHAPMDVLGKTADGLPGFGIVAAVLGIVVTMGHINGPVEEIGHKVGAALVGTFLGILMSYGFIAPLVVTMDFMGRQEMAYFRAIAAVITGFVKDMPPKVAVEVARRGVPTDLRPSAEELETAMKAC